MKEFDDLPQSMIVVHNQSVFDVCGRCHALHIFAKIPSH
jgi:hypothetical protein